MTTIGCIFYNTITLKYGVTLERKAIGYNVKLLAELLSEEDSPIKVVTKRKLGTYISGRYMEDEDITFLIDLVMSNYSISSEHRKRLFDKLSKMASVSFRRSQSIPATFDLVDPEDSEDFAYEKHF